MRKKILDELIRNIKSRYIMYFHNDPLSMNGSKSIKQRLDIISKVEKIIFVSEWTQKRFFYDSEADAVINNPNSSSFHPSEHQSMAYESKLFRLFYKQDLLTKDNTIDGKEPVEITITSPTKLVTQEPGDSKLKVD